MTHGTFSAYVKGCRCDPCRTANTDHGRAWREKRRNKELIPQLAQDNTGRLIYAAAASLELGAIHLEEAGMKYWSKEVMKIVVKMRGLAQRKSA